MMRGIIVKILGGVVAAAAAVVVFAVVVPAIRGDGEYVTEPEIGVEGVWAVSERSGNVPTAIPTRLYFFGEGTEGRGEFTELFTDFTVEFEWSITEDGFFMSHVPGIGTGRFSGYTQVNLNAERDTLVFRYPNGASLTFTRRQ